MIKFSEISMSSIDEMRSLVASKDLDLSKSRGEYKRIMGHDTKLSDDDLLRVHASQDDDYGIEDIVRRMVAMENGDDIPEPVVITEDTIAILNAFEGNEKRKTTLSPAEVQEMVDDAAAEDKTMTVTDWINAIVKAEKNKAKHEKAEQEAPVSPLEFENRMAAAIRVARKIGEDAEFNSEIDKDMEAKDRSYIGPVQLSLVLARILGDDMASAPDYGTTKDDTKGTNALPDVFVAPAKPGEKKGKKTSFWLQVADKTTKGSALVAREEELNKAFNKKEGYNPDLLIPDKGGFKPEDLKLEWQSAYSRLRYYRQCIADARQVWERIRDINAMAHVKARIKTEKVNGHEQVRRLREPIFVSNDKTPDADDYRYVTFSWGSLKQLKPKKAKAGTIDALLETAKRDTDGGATSTVSEIKTVDQYELHLAVEAHFLEDGKNLIKFEERIAKAVRDNDEAFILSFGKVCMAYDNMWTKIEHKYREINTRIEKLEKGRKVA